MANGGNIPANKRVVWLCLGLGIVAVVGGGWYFIDPHNPLTSVIWFAGAGALGLLSGFTTGASEQTGIGSEFLKFVAGAILVPLLGGVASLLQLRQGSKESFTYAEGQLKEKSTEVTLPAGYDIHPLWVLGAFFFAYSICAVLGILLGMALRTWGNVAIKVRH